MQKSLIALVVCLLAASCGNTEAPKADARIEGRRLESESLGFRIEAPEGYAWRRESMAGENKYLFIAENGTAKVRFIIQGRHFSAATEEHVREYLDGMRGPYEKRGMKIEDVVLNPLASKLGDGYRYAFQVTGRAATVRVDGYVVANDRLYNLEQTSLSSEDV